MRYTNNNVVATEFSRRREHEPSTARTFVRLIMSDYKRIRQSRRQVVRIQSNLCEVACEEKSHGLKIAVVKIYGTVAGTYFQCPYELFPVKYMISNQMFSFPRSINSANVLLIHRNYILTLNIATKMKTVCYRLTFRTIGKRYTNNQTDKCNELLPNKPETTSMTEKTIDKYANLQTTMQSQQSSREGEPSTARTFVRLIMSDYKSIRQSRRQVVRIQSALCEVACEEKSHGLKITVVKIYRTVAGT